jgi:hypothetical protein
MAQVKFMVVWYDFMKHRDQSMLIEINAKTAKGLLREAKKLADKYSVYDKRKETKLKADVFIFDPKKSRENVPPCLSFIKPEYLFKMGGYPAIAQAVQEAQGIDLKIESEKK